MDDLTSKETSKYNRIWQKVEYKFYSNECREIQNVINWAKPRPIHKILVVGCGEGYGIRELELAGFDVVGLDLVDVLKVPIKNKLIISPLWDLNEICKNQAFDLIVAIDVLEHIPPEKIKTCLSQINNNSKFFYFSIACRSDQCGKLIEENLHLTVHLPYWWLNQIQARFSVESYHGGMANIIVMGRKKL